MFSINLLTSSIFFLFMSKKKSFLFQICKDTIIGTFWILKTIVGAVWFVFIKILELVGKLFEFFGFAAKKVHGSAKNTQSEYKVYKSQPKIPAKHEELKTVTAVKGSIENFSQHLEKESIIIAIAGKRGSGKSALGFRL